MKRGAVLGGTLVWAAPLVQTISMSSARAQASPPPPVPFDGPSFVAMNVLCGGVTYFVKFEGDDNEFEDSPGLPSATGCSMTAAPNKVNGSTLGMSGSAVGNCITINPGGCTILESAVKKGLTCVSGGVGPTFCS